MFSLVCVILFTWGSGLSFDLGRWIELLTPLHLDRGLLKSTPPPDQELLTPWIGWRIGWSPLTWTTHCWTPPPTSPWTKNCCPLDRVKDRMTSPHLTWTADCWNPPPPPTSPWTKNCWPPGQGEGQDDPPRQGSLHFPSPARSGLAWPASLDNHGAPWSVLPRTVNGKLSSCILNQKFILVK